MKLPIPKIMIINLQEERVTVEERKELAGLLGGVSLAVQLYKEYGCPEIDPLDPSQPIILTKGPMNTIFPVVTKTCSLFKSPLTGELGESYGGMRLSMAMGLAGITGLIILGKGKRPTVLLIEGEKVQFKDATPLWGLNTDETTRLLHDLPGKRGLRSILTIGQGGERKVRFASITVDTYRHFGRLGLGALMGSKKIKGIVIEGDASKRIEDVKEYRRVYEDIYRRINETDIMEKYHGIGTSINIKALNEIKALPTYNFRQGSFEQAEQICGEFFANHLLIKKIACSGCPIGCIHIAHIRKQYGDPNEFEGSSIAYDHELLYSLGSMLGVGKAEEILRLIEVVELFGLDGITTGVLLAWLTEAFEEGVIGLEETIEAPAFGNVEGYLKIIPLLVYQPNEFYILASHGTNYLANHYGGLDYAMVLGKNEVAGYHTGYGNLLGQAVGARHSHLDNAGYSFDQEKKSFNPKELVKSLIQEEIDRNLLNSLVVCLFARKIYDETTIKVALHSIGYPLKEKDLRDLARFTFFEKIALKEKMGYSIDELSFPKRFFETKAGKENLNSEVMAQLLKEYSKQIVETRKSFENEHVNLFAQIEIDKKFI